MVVARAVRFLTVGSAKRADVRLTRISALIARRLARWITID